MYQILLKNNPGLAKLLNAKTDIDNAYPIVVATHIEENATRLYISYIDVDELVASGIAKGIHRFTMFEIQDFLSSVDLKNADFVKKATINFEQVIAWRETDVRDVSHFFAEQTNN